MSTGEWESPWPERTCHRLKDGELKLSQRSPGRDYLVLLYWQILPNVQYKNGLDKEMKRIQLNIGGIIEPILVSLLL